MAGPEKELANPGSAFEPSDWPLKPIGLLALGIALFIFIVVMALRIGLPAALPDQSRALEVTPPAPVLQVSPAEDLAKFRGHERDLLHSYGWVDRQHGIVRIPIERAMKDVAEKGIDGFPKGEPR